MCPPDSFDPADYDQDDDGQSVECNRCGEMGLFWIMVTAPDGKSEKPVLFNASHRRHVCKINDYFKAVPE